ncbi:diphthine methyltransferase-like isoform X2 [Armigeres subalbatus]|uniref:diphthine methyltransferase-like isoform X2 n=1 Tax=Armigeres subalbatus TaxID=124917 RepID=UPI002ED24060
MPSTITTLHTYDTVYSADSVEWCPHNPYQQLFVCGTYQLDDKEESPTSNTSQTVRKGRILLFEFNSDQNALTNRQQVETSAILDQKWHPTRATLSTVNASGDVVAFKLSSDEKLVEIDTLKIPNDTDGEQLALSIDWAPGGDLAAVSDSKGGISLLGDAPEGLKFINRWNAHSFEAWICAFDKNDQNVIYTGGDDVLLCAYDIRCSNVPALRLKNKTHGAGVTSLLSVQRKEHLLVTGSYDDCVRLFDTRSMKNCLSETNLGGGVWRLKQNPSQPDQILCACMYHNFSVVSLNSDQSFTIDAEYDEHGSICYGCDWKYGLAEGYVKYFASCSFYDHKMCLAVLKTEK